MSLSSSPIRPAASTTLAESIEPPVRTMEPFTPGQCLLCPLYSPTFSHSVMHMQKSHGLFIPNRQHLAVDLETLFEYLHLVIFGYRECIQCGTSKGTVQAIQQHMTGKGHCKFDIYEKDSEFVDFYDFSESKDHLEWATEDDRTEGSTEVIPTSSSQKSLMADQDSIHLPSGRIITKKSSAQAERSMLNRLKRHNRDMASRIEDSASKPDDMELHEQGFTSHTNDIRTLSRKEKREMAAMKYQRTNLSGSDRRTLMHLSAPQQRSLLALQHRQAKRVQNEEQRRQSHVDRKGNKNLYAYWATETPVYLCG